MIATGDSPVLPNKIKHEREFWRQGVAVLGVDEVGRGCWAGPVYAAACIIDPIEYKKLSRVDRSLIRDSKKLSRKQRADAQLLIIAVAHYFSIGMADVTEVDRFGILGATFLAMKRSISLIDSERFHMVVVDGKLKIPNLTYTQHAVIDADNKYVSVAAASIMAKQARDAWMIDMANRYPGYGFENHVGYGTEEHQRGISQLGLCPLHRRSFKPIRMVHEQTVQLST